MTGKNTRLFYVYFKHKNQVFNVLNIKDFGYKLESLICSQTEAPHLLRVLIAVRCCWPSLEAPPLLPCSVKSNRLACVSASPSSFQQTH